MKLTWSAKGLRIARITFTGQKGWISKFIGSPWVFSHPRLLKWVCGLPELIIVFDNVLLFVRTRGITQLNFCRWRFRSETTKYISMDRNACECQSEKKAEQKRNHPVSFTCYSDSRNPFWQRSYQENLDPCRSCRTPKSIPDRFPPVDQRLNGSLYNYGNRNRPRCIPSCTKEKLSIPSKRQF